MNNSTPHRAKIIQAAIREVLCRDWDPLAVCGAGVRDEYDSYIAPLYRRLLGKPSRTEVVRELQRIESEYLGVQAPSGADLISVADKLLAINVTLRTLGEDDLRIFARR